jgi:hypothetical protein
MQNQNQPPKFTVGYMAADGVSIGDLVQFHEGAYLEYDEGNILIRAEKTGDRAGYIVAVIPGSRVAFACMAMANPNVLSPNVDAVLEPPIPK